MSDYVTLKCFVFVGPNVYTCVYTYMYIMNCCCEVMALVFVT